MSYSSVLVFLDNSAASQRRLDFELKFAARHRAHLTGIHLSYRALLPFDPCGQISGVALEWEQEVQKVQQESKQNFFDVAKNFEVNVDWDCYRDTDLQEVLARSRVADIGIVGQIVARINDSGFNRNFFTHFMIDAGRPLLFIPAEKEFSENFEKVVVAWDGGRESSRTLADAMPLLQAARIVSVITVAAKKTTPMNCLMSISARTWHVTKSMWKWKRLKKSRPTRPILFSHASI